MSFFQATSFNENDAPDLPSCDYPGHNHHEVNYDVNPTVLYRAIEQRQWKTALARVQHCPSEASTWVYELEPKDKDGSTTEVIRWKVLPLHQAAAREPPSSLIYALLAAHPDGVAARFDRDKGNLPLHYALQWGASVEVIKILLIAYPQSLEEKDNRNRTLIEIAKAAANANSAEVLHALNKGVDYYESKRRHVLKHGLSGDDLGVTNGPVLPPVVGPEDDDLSPTAASSSGGGATTNTTLPSRMSMIFPQPEESSPGKDSGRAQYEESARLERSAAMAKSEARNATHVDEESWKQAGLTIVVIGASGDLAKKKTYPSLLNLYDDNLLPDDTMIWGYARSDMTHEELRDRLRPYLAKTGNHDERVIDEFLRRCFYKRGASYGDLDAYAEMGNAISQHEREYHNDNFGHNRLFYLAVPPNVFAETGIAIKKSSCWSEEQGWNRIIVEKPFGRDLASCEDILGVLSDNFDEDSLYRIDHYLGKEMVQNLLVLRFGNLWFERLWNRNDVQCVIITFKEPFGTEGRGGYFDQYGIIRDIIQNHLLQVLSLLAMEPPIKLEGVQAGEKIRDAKVQVLESIPPVTIDEVFLGQYEGYTEDPTISNKDSNTPTFAIIRVFVHTPRWAGVPFIFKAGKALDERKAEMRIQFKDPPAADFMFDSKCPRNELVMRMQPKEAIYIKTNVKSPGFSSDPIQGELEVNYDTRFFNQTSESNPDAYTRLILDVLRGRSAAFVRDDELRRSWEIFTPVLHQIDRENVKPHIYKRGSRGPEGADGFVNVKSGYVRNKDYVFYDGAPERKTEKVSGLCDVGLYGLAVMGQNLALNMASHGFTVCVGNRSPSKVDLTVQRAKKEGNVPLVGSKDTADFIAKLSKPRKVIVLVMAGKPVDDTIKALSAHMEAGDILIDGGNEWHPNSIRRAQSLESKGILFMGMGISGGEEGARKGPSFMVGGPKDAYDMMERIFSSCAAQVHDGPCTGYLGPIGSGNYVKMVHNGIEYSDMQLIAEAYDIMKNLVGLSNDEMSEVFAAWNRSPVSSYLIEITASILARHDDITGKGQVVDYILDQSGMNGTARWAVKEAAEQSVAAPTMAASLNARFLGARKEERVHASTILKAPKVPSVDRRQIIEDLREALYASKVSSYAQSFVLIKAASDANGWDIKLSECARLWKGGCIIRASLLDKIQAAFSADSSLQNLMLDPGFASELNGAGASWRRVVAACAESGIACPALCGSLNYFDTYRRGRLPANLTQAQRDFFGGHTYERIDREGPHHSAWTEAHKDIGDISERRAGEK